jgi:hypothetical protein
MARWVPAMVVTLALLVVSCGRSTNPAPPASTDPTTTVTGSTGESDEPPPPAPAGDPTAADLIIAAQEAGSLDEATALLYRVYAIFGDPRLPDEYRSEHRSEDGGALALAVDRLEELPPDIAAELRPFLARPADPESVFYGPGEAVLPTPIGSATGAAPRMMLASSRIAAQVVCSTGWGYIDGRASFRVWGACGTDIEDEMLTVATMMEELWPAETGFMKRQPIKDLGGPYEGGSDRIDIYLVGTCITRGGRCVGPGQFGVTPPSPRFEGPAASLRSSAFIVINRDLVADGTVKATLAHEFFHVLQLAFNFRGRLEASGHHWFSEASATWAEWYFVPESVAWDAGAHERFLGFQYSQYSLQSTASDNAYWSFAWPLFMEQERGAAAVAAAWQAIEGRVGHAQVTEAIHGQLSFESRFRDFAVRAYNTILTPGDPISPLLPAKAVGEPRIRPLQNHKSDTRSLPANQRGTPPLKITEVIPSLYAVYRPFTVQEGVGQVKLDFGGLKPAGSLDVDLLLKTEKNGWERRKLPDGATTLCRNRDDEKVEEMIVVLSNHDRNPRGLLVGSWTVESLVDPCVGYRVEITWSDSWNGVEDTAVFTGVIDTVDPDALPVEGGVFLIGKGTVTGTRAAWAACSVNLDPPPVGGEALFGAQIIGDQVTVSAFSVSYPSTQPFTLPREGGTLTIESATADGGELCPHTWKGTIVLTQLDGT